MDSYIEETKKEIITATEQRKEHIIKYAELLDQKAKESADELVEKLKKERKMSKLTQGDISNLTGIATPNVARLEACKSVPSLQILTRYADAMGYDLELTLKKKPQ